MTGKKNLPKGGWLQKYSPKEGVLADVEERERELDAIIGYDQQIKN